jgi:phenylalanyl-tRNA synthetase beta chain
LKGIIESIFIKLGIDRSKISVREFADQNIESGLAYELNEKPLAALARLNSAVLRSAEIRQEVFYADIIWDRIVKALPKHEHKYEAVSKFPTVRRDLALVIDKKIKFEDLKNTAVNAERRLLKKVSIFDIYEGDKIPDGKKSYALSFVLQDAEKTMTDKVIDKSMRKIQQALEKEFDAELR